MPTSCIQIGFSFILLYGTYLLKVFLFSKGTYIKLVGKNFAWNGSTNDLTSEVEQQTGSSQSLSGQMVQSTAVMQRSTARRELESEQTRKTVILRKEEDVAARDRFVRDYVDEHYEKPICV
jgi:hypothetical protein